MTVNGQSDQTVITLDAPSADAAAGIVFVVIAADVPESSIQDAIAAFPTGGG